MQKLFKVIMDGYSVKVVAHNKNEAREFCYKCFDFSNFKIFYLDEVYCTHDYPYFPGKNNE